MKTRDERGVEARCCKGALAEEEEMLAEEIRTRAEGAHGSSKENEGEESREEIAEREGWVFLYAMR